MVFFEDTCSPSSRLQGVSDYTIWAFKTKLLLQSEGVWEVVKPRVKRPAGSATERIVTSPAAVKQTNGNEEGTDSPEMGRLTSALEGTTLEPCGEDSAPSAKEIEKMKTHAMCILVFAVSNPIICIISRLKDPAEVWERLKERFEAAAIRRGKMLKLRLLTLRPSTGKSMKDHLKLIRSLNTQIACAGVHVEDHELVRATLISAPRSWRKVFSTALSVPRKTLTFDELEEYLEQYILSEEQSRRNETLSR